MNAYADIIINRNSPAMDRVFTYALPPGLQAAAQPGMLALAPFNRERLEGVIIRLHDQPPEGVKLREIAELVGERPLFSGELLQLAAWISEYYVCSRAAAMQAMLPAGMMLSGRPPRIYYQDVYRLAPEARQLRLSRERQRLIAWLEAHAGPEGMSGGDLRAAGFSRDYLRSAVKAGLLTAKRQRLDLSGAAIDAQPVDLNQEQQAAYERLLAEQAGRSRPCLLHGVTASGKTEIYLRLIQAAADRGQQSIVLVPEIALSAQMVDMLSRRLDAPPAVLHSGLKPAERRQVWQDIAEGRVGAVVGPRSAVFAPLPDLGLIIIDEEHETSYKQDNQPRFHARDVALERARLTGCALVLGSATPSVESYYHAERGDYAYVQLSRQYYPAPPPEVSIVDMRAEFREGHKSMFSRPLLSALEDTLARGEQSLLFLNRRGYYRHMSCRDCGNTITCPHCAVAMSYHYQDGAGACLLCHYCGRSLPPPQVCPLCGSKHIRHFGVGTERVADELSRLLPQARVLRLDSDVLRERGSHLGIYRAMREGDADILVGTQMVAKGLDFPRLHLAAVMAADTMLSLPDWRANERCFQLISQLIGRAGRRNRQGRAIIQTYTPDALPVLTAAAGDYLGFYRAELQERRLHGYPPFMHIIRLLFTAPEQEGLLYASLAYAAHLRRLLPPGAELCGPADAPLSRIKDRWRRQLLIKCGDVRAAARAAEQAGRDFAAQERPPAGWRVIVDVDPLNLM